MNTAYKIRKFQNGKNKKGEAFINYSLTVPSNIAREVEDEFFAVELTKDGILFRPIDPNDDEVHIPWKSRNGKTKGATKKAAAKKAAPKKSTAKKASPAKKTGAAKRTRPASKKSPAKASAAKRKRPGSKK